jgi:hypothetical protein
MDQVNLYFSGDPEVYFYTFTEQADSGRDIMADLRRFRKTLQHGLKIRQPGTQRTWLTKWPPLPKAKAFYVKEFTKRGVRHIHMITTLHMSNEELAQRWRYATYGISDQARVTESQSIRSPAGYMMKYMGKQLTEDREQFYEGEYQFKKHERRTGFWKPEGMTTIPKIAWEHAPTPGEEIQVELGHQWNEESTHWRSWYDDLAARWGEPFTRYMEYSTLNEIQKARISGITEILNEINYDYLPEDLHEDPDHQLIKAAMIHFRETLKNKRLNDVKRQTEEPT